MNTMASKEDISQFGMMFFQDRTAAIREMLRVMPADGRLAVAVWDSLENSEAYPEEVALLERLAGRQAADVLRAPFVMGDKAALTELFQGAGVGEIEIATHHGTARFPSVRAMVEADLKGWLPAMGVQIAEDLIEDILEQAEQALGGYITEEGNLAFDSPGSYRDWEKNAALGFAQERTYIFQQDSPIVPRLLCTQYQQVYTRVQQGSQVSMAQSFASIPK